MYNVIELGEVSLIFFKENRIMGSNNSNSNRSNTTKRSSQSSAQSSSQSASRNTSSKKAKAGSATAATMQITSRVTNIKRHTTGYVINGKIVSVEAAKKMAARGQIKGVRVVGDHIQAMTGARRLSELPVKVVKN